MYMCRWMGSHFHDCITINGVTFGRSHFLGVSRENSGKWRFKNEKISLHFRMNLIKDVF